MKFTVLKMRFPSILLAACLIAAPGTGYAQTGKLMPASQGVERRDPEAMPVIDQRALDLLKKMSDTLDQSKTLSFKARSIVPRKSPGGIWISLAGSSRVIREGHSKLFDETRGDFFPYDFYFDGNKITAFAPGRNLYAEKNAPGTIDDLIERICHEEGKVFPYADILISNPYEILTAGLLGALFVGQSTLAGVKTNHLAFSNPGVDWQIWIGADDNLPRLVNATYLTHSKEPSYTVEFTDWKVNEPVPPETFVFANTSNAAKVEFKIPNASPANIAGQQDPQSSQTAKS